ncbi:thioesterase family protein [Streptomyces sp. ACA25]|uniref:acyl-CoA thioesterase n=1 Tax=Streptomyces sp. ACA25 TaxID=3022596 RepID=UPI002307771F|nr:thioesterase family protein [Streptomyces sp. ACA25]MDB1087136.1 thioesterase family protein [Streptomyces sp. ACA25]
MTPDDRRTDRPESLPGCFRTTTGVAWDELDALGVLHHSRFLVHAERAFSALLDSLGYGYDPDPGIRPERHHVVAGVRVTFSRPLDRPGPLTIEQQVESLGRTSLTLRFTVTGGAGGQVLAEGVRTVVHIDRATRRPRPWSTEFRERLRAGLAALPAGTDPAGSAGEAAR